MVEIGWDKAAEARWVQGIGWEKEVEARWVRGIGWEKEVELLEEVELQSEETQRGLNSCADTQQKRQSRERPQQQIEKCTQQLQEGACTFSAYGS